MLTIGVWTLSMESVTLPSAMHQPLDILSLAQKSPVMHEDLHLVQEKDQCIPGTVNYSIRRYRKSPQWNIEDTGMMHYHYEASSPENNYLELRFCISGNRYCKQKDVECDHCKLNMTKTCSEKVETVDVMSFSFRANTSCPIRSWQIESEFIGQDCSIQTWLLVLENTVALCPHTYGTGIVAESLLQWQQRKYIYQCADPDVVIVQPGVYDWGKGRIRFRL